MGILDNGRGGVGLKIFTEMGREGGGGHISLRDDPGRDIILIRLFCMVLIVGRGRDNWSADLTPDAQARTVQCSVAKHQHSTTSAGVANR